MRRIYIAGPITGVYGYEKNFNDAADMLREKGYEVVNPIEPGLVDGASYRFYIDRGLQKLMKCNTIYLLNGWEDSKGARLERDYAIICGLDIIYEV